MSAWLAHLLLFGRHGRSVWVGGVYWRYCLHRSHRLHLPCWRWFFYDSLCAKHNGTCWGGCDREDGEGEG